MNRPSRAFGAKLAIDESETAKTDCQLHSSARRTSSGVLTSAKSDAWRGALHSTGRSLTTERAVSARKPVLSKAVPYRGRVMRPPIAEGLLRLPGNFPGCP